MKNEMINGVKFNDIPFFNGDKGFAVVYLSGEFHLFFPYSTLMKGWVMHYVSTDGFAWEQKEVAVFVKKPVDSVAAYVQNGKIYLYYLTYNIFGKTDLNLTVSKDGENFLPFPSALIKNTALRDIKCFYSGGTRYLVGSEIKGDLIPTYLSLDGVEWVKSGLAHLVSEQSEVTYLGAPSPFVAYDRSYVAYSMCGAHIAEADYDLSANTVKVGELVQSFEGGVVRSTMVGEGNPLLFVGVGSALVTAECYFSEKGIGFRLYREILKGARLLVDKGVEKGKTQPTEWLHESDIYHIFSLPFKSGVSLTVGDLVIKVGESGELTIGNEEIYPECDTLELSLLDEGGLVVVEVCDKVYPVLTDALGTIKLSGTEDFSHECYRIRGNYEL
ncbi:MAG: hypothetical protein IJ033_04135 [Clostridia bacterium]|nr:hypothetical protein [Clostridia bacterium]